MRDTERFRVASKNQTGMNEGSKKRKSNNKLKQEVGETEEQQETGRRRRKMKRWVDAKESWSGQ